MNLFQHVLNVAGHCAPLKKLPSPGVTVTKVQWDGCMATIRKEVDVGDLVRYEKHGRYDGMIVKYDKAGERWEPLDDLRIVNGETEIWG